VTDRLVGHEDHGHAQSQDGRSKISFAALGKPEEPFNTPSATPIFFDMKIMGHSSREMFLRYDTVDAVYTLKAADQNVDQAPSKVEEN
jgi:hypothetical protein